MSSARIPAWWVLVGAETATRMEDLFARVLADIPLSHKELADHMNVNPSTVTRWANGKTTPPPGKMLEAVRAVREHLQPLLDRATFAEEALGHLVAAETAQEEDGGGLVQEEVTALNEMLEDGEPGPRRSS